MSSSQDGSPYIFTTNGLASPKNVAYRAIEFAVNATPTVAATSNWATSAVYRYVITLPTISSPYDAS